MRRIMSRIVSICFFCIVCFGCYGCYNEESIPVATRELPSQIVDNFQMQESKSGDKLYTLTGRRAYFYDKRNEIVVMDPFILFYNEKTEVTSEVKCDSGVVNNQTGDLIAYGHVVVTTKDSTILKTDSLAWLNRPAQIETDAEVFITSPQGTIQGKGLLSDANLIRIEIKEQVTGTTPYSVGDEE